MPWIFFPLSNIRYIYINIYISFLAEVSTVFITQRKMWLWMMKYPDTKVLGTLLAEAPPEEELQILCFAVSHHLNDLHRTAQLIRHNLHSILLITSW